MVYCRKGIQEREKQKMSGSQSAKRLTEEEMKTNAAHRALGK